MKREKIGHKRKLSQLTVDGDAPDLVIITIHEDGWIHTLGVSGMQDDDILDLSYFPKQLRILSLSHGDLTRIEMGKLPQKLTELDLSTNKISEMIVESVPPLLKILNLGYNRLKDDGVTLNLPLPNRLALYINAIGSLKRKDGQNLHEPTGEEKAWIVTCLESLDETQIKVFVDQH